MRFLQRHETTIALFGIAILAVGYFDSLYLSGAIAKQQIEDEIAQAQAQIDGIPLVVAERALIRSRLDDARTKSLVLDNQVPSQSHASDVLHNVAHIARESRLTITRLEPLPSSEFGSYSSHPFLLGCSGTFADVTKFLNGLETQSRLVTFRTVELARASEGRIGQSKEIPIQLNLHFNVYSRHANSTRITENTASRDALPSDN